MKMIAKTPQEVCPELCFDGEKHEFRWRSASCGEYFCKKCDKICPDFIYPCGGCSCHGHINCDCFKDV